jgi:hypothetical protein
LYTTTDSVVSLLFLVGGFLTMTEYIEQKSFSSTCHASCPIALVRLSLRDVLGVMMVEVIFGSDTTRSTCSLSSFPAYRCCCCCIWSSIWVVVVPTQGKQT